MLAAKSAGTNTWARSATSKGDAERALANKWAETKAVKRLSGKVLMKLAAVGLVVIAALALGRDAALASGSGSLWLAEESAVQNANAPNSVRSVLAFEPADRCADDCCAGLGGASGVHPSRSSHGASGSGAAVAPGTAGLIAPPRSGDRMIARRTAAI